MSSNDDDSSNSGSSLVTAAAAKSCRSPVLRKPPSIPRQSTGQNMNESMESSNQAAVGEPSLLSSSPAELVEAVKDMGHRMNLFTNEYNEIVSSYERIKRMVIPPNDAAAAAGDAKVHSLVPASSENELDRKPRAVPTVQFEDRRPRVIDATLSDILMFVPFKKLSDDGCTTTNGTYAQLPTFNYVSNGQNRTTIKKMLAAAGGAMSHIVAKVLVAKSVNFGSEGYVFPESVVFNNAESETKWNCIHPNFPDKKYFLTELRVVKGNENLRLYAVGYREGSYVSVTCAYDSTTLSDVRMKCEVKMAVESWFQKISFMRVERCTAYLVPLQNLNQDFEGFGGISKVGEKDIHVFFPKELSQFQNPWLLWMYLNCCFLLGVTSGNDEECIRWRCLCKDLCSKVEGYKMNKKLTGPNNFIIPLYRVLGEAVKSGFATVNLKAENKNHNSEGGFDNPMSKDDMIGFMEIVTEEFVPDPSKSPLSQHQQKKQKMSSFSGIENFGAGDGKNPAQSDRKRP